MIQCFQLVLEVLNDCEDLLKSLYEGTGSGSSSRSKLQATTWASSQGFLNDRLSSRRYLGINQGFQDAGFRDATRIARTTEASSYVNSSSSKTTSVPRLPPQWVQLREGTSNTSSKDASSPVTCIFLIYGAEAAREVRLSSRDAAACLSSLKSLERLVRKTLPEVDKLLSRGSGILQLKGVQARMNPKGLGTLSLGQSVPLESDNDLSSLAAGSQKECGAKEDTYLSFWVEVKDHDINSSSEPAPPPPTTSILASQKKLSEELKYPPYSKQHRSDDSTDSRSRASTSKPYTAAPAPVPAGQQRPSQIEIGAATTLLPSRREQLQQKTSTPLEGLPGEADFRKMSIIPQKEELLISVRKTLSSLPINKVGQRHRYSSVMEYLETHFQLLREDYVHSLRQGIRIYRSSKYAAVNDPTSGLIFYSPVQLVDLLCGEKGVEYTVTFCIKFPDKKRRIRFSRFFDSTKLLMPGALLCISADDFQTFFWGVVGLRDARELSNGQVSIQILDVDPGPPENHKFQAGKVYTMVESSEAYFEPYSHVLASLQREEMNNLPFSQYLVQLETKVGPPSYMLGRHKRDEYDLSSAFPDIVHKLGRSYINVMQEWPHWEHSLDKAQMDALKVGLTKELAIIQGPPGTGKTFITLLLVKILLANLHSKSLARSGFTSESTTGPAAGGRSVPDERCGDSEEDDCEKLSMPPILIVCYTNQALDQFIEGICQTEKDVIRIGGGRKSNMLQERSLWKLLKEQRANIEGSLHREYFRASGSREVLKHRILACKGVAIGTPIEQVIAGHHHKLEDLCPEYESACKALSEVEDEIELSVLRTAKVIGMTTSGAAKHRHTLKSLRPEIIIADEAADVMESHILACLTPSVKHLILVGDSLQRRPKTAFHELAANHRLDVSMFERLVTSGVEHVTLQTQRRMRPCISKLAKILYPHLKDHHSVTLYPDVKGLFHNLFFFDHKAPKPTGGDPGSVVNVKEARLVVELSRYLQMQGCYAAKDITVLTGYPAQAAEIRKHLRQRCGVKVDASSENDDEVDLELFPRVTSIDNYQGEECEIIILSLVGNHASSNRGESGFLSVINRVCVALTRARKGLYIFGNAAILANKSSLWKDVIKGMRESGSVGTTLRKQIDRFQTAAFQAGERRRLYQPM